jgi:hypothetical protein
MNALALVIGAALIAAAIAVSHRYSIVTHSCGDDCSRAWIVNQWTGRAIICDFKIIVGQMPTPSGAVCFGMFGEVPQ